MSTELATRTAGLQITTVDDLARIADMMAKSGFFQDSRDAAQAGVKIMAGQGWGINPFDAMTGIHIISGRPSIGAGLMASKVKGSGKYDYRVLEMSNDVCRIEFLQRGESIGVSEFTLADAKKAGTKNLDKFARNMLFARAMSNGVRWFCPDVFTTPVYTPEELGASVDGDGNVIDVPARAAREATPARPALDAITDGITAEELEAIAEPREVEQPALDVEPITGAQLKALHAVGSRLGFTNAQRDDFRAFVGSLVGRTLESSKDLTKAEASTLLDRSPDEWLGALDAWNVERDVARDAATSSEEQVALL